MTDLLGTETAPKPWRPREGPRTTIDFNVYVMDEDGDTVTLPAKGLDISIATYNALDVLLLGEVNPLPDATGANEMKARRIKLKHVLEELGNLDKKAFGSKVLKRGPLLDAAIDDERNDNMIYRAWEAYAGALNSSRRKSADADSGDTDGGSAAGAAGD